MSSVSCKHFMAPFVKPVLRRLRLLIQLSDLRNEQRSLMAVSLMFGFLSKIRAEIPGD